MKNGPFAHPGDFLQRELGATDLEYQLDSEGLPAFPAGRTEAYPVLTWRRYSQLALQMARRRRREYEAGIAPAQRGAIRWLPIRAKGSSAFDRSHMTISPTRRLFVFAERSGAGCRRIGGWAGPGLPSMRPEPLVQAYRGHCRSSSAAAALKCSSAWCGKPPQSIVQQSLMAHSTAASGGPGADRFPDTLFQFLQAWEASASSMRMLRWRAVKGAAVFR